MLDLSRTELHLADLSGEVINERDGVVVARWPRLPEYFSGNALWLPRPPRPGELRGLLARFDVSYPDAAIRHACLRWSDRGALDEGLDAAVLEESRDLGFRYLSGLAMRMDEPPPAPSQPYEVRPVSGEAEWAALVDLNVRNDPSEAARDTGRYRVFKQRMREHWRRWVDAGQATWWGAWAEGELVGCCGVVDTPWGGRFQAVETDTAWRRRGVCSALVATACRHGLTEAGHPAMHLSAEADGPARGLYERLGFRADGWQRYLIWSEESGPLVRPEHPADRAGVDSLVRAAFSGSAGAGAPEVAVLRALRDDPESLSLVVETDGEVHGHVLLSRVFVRPKGGAAWPALGLSLLAVRPDQQGQGLSRALVESALDLADARGERVCVVLGDPAYYGRFGFEDAAPHGFSCRWEVPPGAFQVRGGPPWPGRPGAVAYAPVFDEAG